MEYNLDIDLEINGHVIIEDMSCKAILSMDNTGDWYVVGVQVEDVERNYVDANHYIDSQVRSAIKTDKHAQEIDRQWADFLVEREAA